MFNLSTFQLYNVLGIFLSGVAQAIFARKLEISQMLAQLTVLFSVLKIRIGNYLSAKNKIYQKVTCFRICIANNNNYFLVVALSTPPSNKKC